MSAIDRVMRLFTPVSLAPGAATFCLRYILVTFYLGVSRNTSYRDARV